MWWLRAACGLTVVVGAVSAAASHPATDGPWLLLFDLLRWPVDGDPAGFGRDARALSAVLGGVMVGWGALMLTLTLGPLAAEPRVLARTLVVGVVGWYVVDSTGSLVAGIPGNVVLNTVFLGLFAPPLVVLLRAEPATGPARA